MSTRILARATRFGFTGLFATGVHVLCAAVLIESFGVRATAANGVAFCSATLLSYLLNTFWTFRRQATRGNAARFWLVSTLGLCLTLLLSGAAEAAQLHYLAGIALVVALVPPVTFVLHSAWTYRDQRPARSRPIR